MPRYRIVPECSYVCIDARSSAHPQSFDQSFSMVAMGTVAEDAVAGQVLLPVRARCGTCKATWPTDDAPLACPACASVDVELTGSDELVLESIEYRG